MQTWMCVQSVFTCGANIEARIPFSIVPRVVVSGVVFNSKGFRSRVTCMLISITFMRLMPLNVFNFFLRHYPRIINTYPPMTCSVVGGGRAPLAFISPRATNSCPLAIRDNHKLSPATARLVMMVLPQKDAIGPRLTRNGGAPADGPTSPL